MHNILTITRRFRSLYYCILSGLPYDSTYDVRGKCIIIHPSLFQRLVLKNNGGTISIGKNFVCNSSITSNSIGIIQPCYFNIKDNDSKIIIGNNVGISGSTINASTCISIGDNTLIGSGCLITDTDSHPIDPNERLQDSTTITKANKGPITIGKNVFIGARCIVLKGVCIGNGSVIGAGSVVTSNIPDHVIACGNPAKVIKSLL